jgi:hypothetical protein
MMWPIMLLREKAASGVFAVRGGGSHGDCLLVFIARKRSRPYAEGNH